MAPNTRNTTRTPPIASTDVEMEDANNTLTLPAPTTYEVVEHIPTQAV